jgi:LasA protease
MAVAAVGLSASLMAGPAVAAPAELDQVVITAMSTKLGRGTAALAAEGRSYRVAVQRRSDGWVFGFAVQRAAFRAGDYPVAWLFLAQREGRQWTVTLDTDAGFAQVAAAAPLGIFNAQEKATFAARRAAAQGISIQAVSSNNTGLRLPYQVGQAWTMTGGPHGWVGPERPFSAIDLAGGDGVVRAGADGIVYTMCADSSGGAPGGWRRVYHANGYTTDYYHLSNLSALTDGSWLGGTKKLGHTGRNVCDGGSASGAHVHWGILDGTTRVQWHWKSAGQWVFWEGSTAHGGYALHGSTRVNVGGTLHNYGKLPATSGIVDANGAGTVNRRSGPGSSYPLAGTINDGAVVSIVCWAYGTTHSGRYGSTNIWNKMADNSWFSDAFAYTGKPTVGSQC